MDDAETQRFHERLLNPQKWQSLERIYHAALSIEQSRRQIFLNQACAGDEELQREVESLLAADEIDDDCLKHGAFELALKVLTDEERWRDEMSDQQITERFEAGISAGLILNSRWEILAPLDAGGMGEVYKAHDLTFPARFVVVKVLKKESKSNPWKVKKFGDEGHAQSRLQHVNVEIVFDKGTLPTGGEFLVMEFIDGSTLRKLMKDHKQHDQHIDFTLVAEIMKQACRGVSAIHKAGLVHRDLKPENIMIRDTGDEIAVKIIDFGIVRVLDKSTVWGQIVGTLPYSSPEQLDGQDVTPASDLYSVGVIAYEMLTGNRPYNPESFAHLLKLQRQGVRIKPSDLRPGLPEAAERVILRALACNANERYDATKPHAKNTPGQLTREFGDELARALTAERVITASTIIDEPGGSSTLGRLAHWFTLDKRRLAGGLTVLAVVIALVLWWSLFRQTSTPVQPQTLPATQVVSSRINGNKEKTAANTSAPMPIYNAEALYPTGPPPQGMTYATIGFTVWRTRPVTTKDGEDTARETIDSQEVASERVADDIADGEKIYLGVESLTGEFLPGKGGYLYVVNREKYADGTFGRARLIFPTLLTYGGNNLVKPGQPIVLPRPKGEPFFIKRSTTNQAAETFTIILSPWAFQLPEQLSDKAMVIPDYMFADWERQYGAKMHRATLGDGVGQTKTKREQDVGSREIIDGAESPLTQDDPLPQTVFKGAVKNGNPAIVTVTLRFKD